MPNPSLVPTCPACGKVITPSNRAVKPWGKDGPELHEECAGDVDETYRLLEAMKAHPTCDICEQPIATANEAMLMGRRRDQERPVHKTPCGSSVLARSFQRFLRTGRTVLA